MTDESVMQMSYFYEIIKHKFTTIIYLGRDLRICLQQLIYFIVLIIFFNLF